MKNFAYIILVSLLLPVVSNAQKNHLGDQNIVQKRSFDWKYVSTEFFDVHYHLDDAGLAAVVARYAEEALFDVCSELDYKNRSRFALYIFASPIDYVQSNLYRVDRVKEGGITPLRNNSLPIVFPGTMRGMQQETKARVAEMVIEDYYFGGSIQKSIQNTVLLYLPKWYIQGLTAYLGEGWTMEDEVWMAGLEHTEMLELALEGEGRMHHLARKSIFHYISNQFGQDKLSEIYYMTRLTRSAEDGVIHVLGITLKTLTERWREFMIQRITEAKTFRQLTTDLGKEVPVDPKDRLLGYAVDPTDDEVAMLVERGGKQRMLIRDLENGEVLETPVEGGFTTDQFRPLHLELPLAWSPNGLMLAGLIYRNGAEMLFFYNTESGKTDYVSYNRKLDRIKDITWSHDGRQLVCSALNSGYMDLYRFGIGASGFVQLTDDSFENLSPIWSQDDQRIYFASNRLNDSIPNSEVRFDVYKDDFDIWELSLEDKSLRRVTETDLVDEFPVAAASSFEILVRTSQNGIFNLDKVNVFLGETSAQTNVSYGFHAVDYTERGIGFSIPHEGRLKLFSAKSYDDLVSEDVRVRTTFQAKRVRELEKKLEAEERKAKLDSLRQVKTANVGEPKKVEPEKTEPTVKYYVFDEEEDQPQKTRRRYLQSRNVLKKKVKERPDFNEFTIKSPSKSKSVWTAEQVSTQFGFDPVFKLSMTLEARLRDQQGNRRLVAGFKPYWDLKSSDAYLSFANRKHNLDYQVGIVRSTRFLVGDGFSSRYNASRINGTVSLPLTRYLSVGAGLHAVYLNRFNIQTIVPREIDADDLVTGGLVNVLYDKRLSEEGFVKSGTYARLDVSNAFSVGNTRNEFITAQFDVRKYIPVRKSVLATRVTGAWSTGDNGQRFFLGGTDEWLFGRFFNIADFPLENHLTDFHYMSYITPSRGFQFNSRNGSKYILANVELRIPAGRVLRSSLNTNPLYNLEIIPFFDFGTAWEDGNPLSQKNPIDTETINQYPLNITVQTLKSPFVMGFGTGLRTSLLGYQVRTDLAWGVEDYTVLTPRLHVSLGKNF